MGPWVLIVVFWCLSASQASSSGPGNTTCRDSSLDWYMQTVGETPCMTYQRLRQLCNPNYSVGALNLSNISIPSDRCNDPHAACCCNSISFGLSMLCLNCQQGADSGNKGEMGIDAGLGSYFNYLKGDGSEQCAHNKNQSLPSHVQSQVCSSNITIDDALYDTFATNGTWSYNSTYMAFSSHPGSTRCNPTSQSYSLLSSSHQSNTVVMSLPTNAGQASSNHQSSPSETQPPSRESDSKGGSMNRNGPHHQGSHTKSHSGHLSGGAIAGIAIGSALISAGLITVVLLLRKRHSQPPPPILPSGSLQVTQMAQERTGYYFPGFESRSVVQEQYPSYVDSIQAWCSDQANIRRNYRPRTTSIRSPSAGLQSPRSIVSTATKVQGTPGKTQPPLYEEHPVADSTNRNEHVE